MMETTFVKLNGVPAKLVTLGENVEEKPKKIVLILPGNPGLASYYEDFMVSLKSKLPQDYAIWTLAHGGHDIPPDPIHLPSLDKNESLFTLEATIQQKIDFISENIDPKEQEIILIGHSIGAKMVLEVMKANVGNVKKGCLLFPTVENMIYSPAGRRLKHTVKAIPTLILVFLAWLGSLLPRSILAKCVKFWLELTTTSNLTDACLSATLDLIHPTAVANILYLANTELQTVLDLDYGLIKTLQDRLWFYYGSSDLWVPLDHYQRLVENVPNVSAELCKREIPHAFVLSNSDTVAEIVASKLNK